MGVDMFLVISGFVITLSAARAYKSHPQHYIRRFMANRLWRIAPLYIATSLVFLLFVQPQLLAAGTKYLVIQGITHGLFIHNLHHSTHGAINGPTWSIGLEMQFYVLIILCIPWLIRQKVQWIILGCLVISWAYRYATTLALPPGATPDHSNDLCHPVARHARQLRDGNCTCTVQVAQHAQSLAVSELA